MTQTKKLFFLILCLAVGQVLVAQTTYTSVQNGSWNQASTWDANGIPPNPIPANATVEIKHNIQEAFTGGLPKTNNGTINIHDDAILVIYHQFDNYGTIDAKGGPAYSEFRIVITTFNNKAGGVLKTSGGPEASITLWNDALLNNEAGGLVEIATDGELRMTFQGNNRLNNAGTIDNRGYILSYGSFVNTAGSKLYNDNARVQMINAPMTIGGEVKLTGDSDISAQGDLTILTGSSIEWVLTSQPSGFNYPYIQQYSGTGTYGTTNLKVSLAPGFEPNGGAIYNLFLNTNPVPADALSLPALTGGKTWKESRAPDYNGIRIEVEEPAPTEPGAALDFDGQNDYVHVNNLGPAPANFSIEAWFKEEGGTGHENIVGWLGNRSGRRQQILVGTQPNGTLRYGNFDYFNFRFSQLNGTTNVRDGKWHHVVVTTTNGKELALYVDGQLEASGTTPDNNTVEDYVNLLRIGAQGVPGIDPVTEHFTGKIDEVRIWGKALCEAEIQARYECELEGDEQGLVAYYQFNKGIAGGSNAGVTTLPDKSSNGKAGTLYNFALNTSNSNWIAPGAVESGNTCTDFVDNAPTLSCPGPINVNSTIGKCGAIVNYTITAADDCGEVELNLLAGQPSGSEFSVGTTTVTYEAKDQADNKKNCSFTVTVNDNEDPVAVCKDVTVDFNGEEDINLTVGQVWNESASSDNCGNVHYVGTAPSLDIGCEELGNTIPLTVTIKDDAGNTDQCTSYVTVNGLPCGWTEGPQDGSLNCGDATSVNYDTNDESFTLTADGCFHDCREPDQAVYAFQQLCGDGELVARLASISSGGYAGLMARESLDPLSRRVGAMKNQSTRTIRREYRSTYGGIVAQLHTSRRNVKWFKIVRQGSRIKTYTSTNGRYWRLLYQVSVPNLADCIYLGMTAYSNNINSEVTAVFKDVQFTTYNSNLVAAPNQWQTLEESANTLFGAGQLTIFPNPAKNQAQIVLNGFEDKAAQIVVRDQFGRIIRQIEVESALDFSESLSVEKLPAGIYHISIVQDERIVSSKKLLVQP